MNTVKQLSAALAPSYQDTAGKKHCCALFPSRAVDMTGADWQHQHSTVRWWELPQCVWAGDESSPLSVHQEDVCWPSSFKHDVFAPLKYSRGTPIIESSSCFLLLLLFAWRTAALQHYMIVHREWSYVFPCGAPAPRTAASTHSRPEACFSPAVCPILCPGPQPRKGCHLLDERSHPHLLGSRCSDRPASPWGIEELTPPP